jgi:HK97 family phage major capsid protein
MSKELSVLENKIQEKRQLRAAKAQEMFDLSEKTSFPAEAEARHKALYAEQDAIAQEIRMLEETLALQKELRSFTPPPTAQPSQTFSSETRTAAKTSEMEMRAFDTYLRYGATAVTSNEELRTYFALDTTTSNQAGGFIVPTTLVNTLEVKLKAYGGMLQDADVVLTSSGNPMNWPTMDDTANKGSWIGENSAVNQTNPTFAQVAMSSYLASSDQVLVSVQELQDAQFPLDSILIDAFQTRVGRLTNDAYTTGSGSGQPKGITVVSGTNSVTNVGDPIAGTAQNSVGIDDLFNLQFAVDPLYQNSPKARYHFNSSTLQAIMKLKDSIGRPLWEPSMSSGAQDLLCGKPYTINQSLVSLGASSRKVAVFGDFSKYKIRRVGNITVFRYSELYMPNHQIGFQAYLRTDGQCVQPSAFAVLVTP